jgi:hypothetical protein
MRWTAPLLVLLVAVACGPAPTSGQDADQPGSSDAPPRADSLPRADAMVPVAGDQDGDDVPDGDDNCPESANGDQLDDDLDNFGNVCDCDPNQASIVGYRVFVDSMTSDSGMFDSPVGFMGANWSFGPDVNGVAPDTGTAYRQTRLESGGEDASFFFGNTLLENVRIDARVASTAIQDTPPNLRQIFLIARAASTGSTFRAQACGIEVVDALTPTQRTSTITLEGSPAAVSSTVRMRTPRRAVQVDEELELHMILEGGDMTCTANLFGAPGNETTTATASGLTSGEGAVGFYTRETRALFKNLRICELP